MRPKCTFISLIPLLKIHKSKGSKGFELISVDFYLNGPKNQNTYTCHVLTAFFRRQRTGLYDKTLAEPFAIS